MHLQVEPASATSRPGPAAVEDEAHAVSSGAMPGPRACAVIGRRTAAAIDCSPALTLNSKKRAVLAARA